jgi:hypothetical protein
MHTSLCVVSSPSSQSPDFATIVQPTPFGWWRAHSVSASHSIGVPTQLP